MNSNERNVQYIEEDEISLTDIIKTIIKRKRVFWYSLIIAFCIPVSYAVYKKVQAYQIASNPESQPTLYVSYLAVGFRTGKWLIEPLETILIAIKEIYLPDSGINHPIEVESDWSKMGNTVKITSKLLPIDVVTSKEIQKQHEFILAKILERHNLLYLEMIPRNISNLNSQMEASPTTIIATAKMVKMSLNEVSGFTNKKFITILGIGFIFAMISGVFSVFIYEFVLNLRKELKD